MPLSNIRILLLIVLLGVYCCTRTTLRDQILLHSMRQVESTALVEPSGQLLFEGAMRGMVEKMGEELGDDYSMYIPPSSEKEFRDLLDSKLEGVGIRFDTTAATGTFKVLYPMLDSPALAAGIRCGDIVLKVDGESTENLDQASLTKKIRGEADTKVVLTVQHDGETEPADIAIRRASIQQNTVFGFEVNEHGGAVSAIAEHPTIGYVYIASFGENTTKEMVQQLLKFSPKMENLILDLRNNPGGYLKAAVDVANLFVDNRGQYKEIVTTRSRDGKLKFGGQYFATDAVMFHGSIFVLIDEGSASASEILAACLQDFGRAKILGQRSFGKGTVQDIFELPLNNGILKLTDSSYWRPSGKNINRIRRTSKSENGRNAKLSEETDDWGVMPDSGMEIKMSRNQRMLTYFLRDLRIAIPKQTVTPMLVQYKNELCKDTSKFLQIDFEDIPEENNESENNETNNDAIIAEPKPKNFEPEGKAPFFDPVLDKAIELAAASGNAPERRKREL